MITRVGTVHARSMITHINLRSNTLAGRGQMQKTACVHGTEDSVLVSPVIVP
jgi:hypothetical protein